MKRLILAAAFLAALASPCAAQFAETGGSRPVPQPMVSAPGGQIGVTPIGAPTYIIEEKPAGSTGGIISLGPITGNPSVDQLAQDLVNALVAAAAGWLFWLLKNKFNINIDQGQRDALTAAAQRQASSLVADGLVSLSGKSIKVDDAGLLRAVSALQRTAPDAIAHFNITDPQHLADRIVDMIPHVPAVAPAVAAAHVADAVVVPLPPQLQLEKPA